MGRIARILPIQSNRTTGCLEENGFNFDAVRRSGATSGYLERSSDGSMQSGPLLQWLEKVLKGQVCKNCFQEPHSIDDYEDYMGDDEPFGGNNH